MLRLNLLLNLLLSFNTAKGSPPMRLGNTTRCIIQLSSFNTAKGSPPMRLDPRRT